LLGIDFLNECLSTYSLSSAELLLLQPQKRLALIQSGFMKYAQASNDKRRSVGTGHQDGAQNDMGERIESDELSPVRRRCRERSKKMECPATVFSRVYPELRRIDPRDRRNSKNKTVFKVANQTGYFSPDC
jgi:hypothetical protein